MIRQLTLVLGLVLLALAAIQIIQAYKPKEVVTVHFKEGVNPPQMRGEVTKRDKYIVIKPEDGQTDEQVYTWEQVRYISGTEQYSKKIERVTESLELLGKLGVLAAAGIFLIGLYQFNVGQLWKGEEFLANVYTEFSKSANFEAAKQMIDVLKFYPNGRMIELYPSREKGEGEGSKHITPEKICDALRPGEDKDLDPTSDKMRIRDCFDAFFSRLERMDHYIDARLVRKKSVKLYMYYWINMLLGLPTEGRKGTTPTLREDYRQVLLLYVETYEFPKVQKLLNKYRENWFTKFLRSATAAATHSRRARSDARPQV